MIENQEELRTALEKNREQKGRIKELEAAQASKQDCSHSEQSAQMQELQARVSGRLRALSIMALIYI